MKKYFNAVSLAFGAIGGIVCDALQRLDRNTIVLLILIIIDYITGVIKAIYKKELSSKTGFRGILKKVMILLVVSAGYVIDRIIASTVPVADMVTVFFIANEGISLLENASEMIPIPQGLKNILVSLREENNGSKN